EKDNMLCDKPDAAPMKCQMSSDCDGDPNKTICEAMECVQCTQADKSACGDNTPICDMGSNSCRACKTSADCESAVCLDSGMCAVKTDVLYVEGGTPNTGTCTFEVPCGTVSYALTITPLRTTMKIKGTVIETSTVTIDNRSLAIYGETMPQAILTRPGGNEILRIDGTSVVSMFHLQLSGATGANGHGISILSGSSGALSFKRIKVINNGGIGITSLGSGKLTLTQSNIFNNDGGGANIEGTHLLDVTSNFFTQNGNTDSVTPSEKGGVRVTANQMTSKFEFNTIAYNGSSGLLNRGGFHCQAPNVSATGNIVYRNSEGSGATVKTDGTTQTHTGVNCNYGNSLVLAMDSVDLGFKMPTSGTFDFHLDPARVPASVKDAGGACTVRDIDNQARPSGAACELGADELDP
nr:right-handed parallel beta-helix repeat-containing protein [Deltaproteobacteria bacterium]